jgi:hypothetical protein
MKKKQKKEILNSPNKIYSTNIADVKHKFS